MGRSVERRQVKLADLDKSFVRGRGETRAQLARRHRREVRNARNLDHYVKDMRGGANFPPVMATEIDGVYFVVDGHHRCCAAGILGHKLIDVVVVPVRSRAEERTVLDLAFRLTEAGWRCEAAARAICLALDARFPR